MSETVPHTELELPRVVRSSFWLYVLVFLSGIAALVYEISWTRQIGVLFGHTTQVAALVLASYFLGMAGGYSLGGRCAKRVHPLIGYALCEVVVAGWACVIPLLLALAEVSWLRPWLQAESGAGQLVARGLFTVLLLGPATCALGATLPFLAEHFLKKYPKENDRIQLQGNLGKLYAPQRHFCQ